MKYFIIFAAVVTAVNCGNCPPFKAVGEKGLPTAPFLMTSMLDTWIDYARSGVSQPFLSNDQCGLRVLSFDDTTGNTSYTHEVVYTEAWFKKNVTITRKGEFTIGGTGQIEFTKDGKYTLDVIATDYSTYAILYYCTPGWIWKTEHLLVLVRPQHIRDDKTKSDINASLSQLLNKNLDHLTIYNFDCIPENYR